MAISGRKDEDDSKKRSLQKAQENGFGQPGVAGRKRYDATDEWAEKARERMPTLIDKSFDAIDRALSSSNTKMASETALKLMKLTNLVDQKVVIEGGETTLNQTNILLQQDNLSAKDRAILSKFHDLMGQVKDEEVIELEAQDVTELDQ